MKKILTLFAGLLLSSGASAATFMADEVIRVNTTIKDDLYTAAEEVRISADSPQDVYSLGRTITVDASVGDDLHAAGQYVQTNSNIAGDAFVVGEGIASMGHEILGDMYYFGESVSLSDLTVKGNAHIYAEGVKFHNVEIQGKLSLGASWVDTSGENSVAGDLIYKSEEEHSEVESFVSGSVIHAELLEDMIDQDSGPYGWIAKLLTYKFFVLFTCSLILVLIVRKVSKAPTIIGEQVSFLKALGVGFLIFIALPALGVLLSLLGITLPLGIFAFILFGVWFFLLGEILAITYIAILIGSKDGNWLVQILAIIGLSIAFTLIAGLDIIAVWWAIGSITLLKMALYKS